MKIERKFPMVNETVDDAKTQIMRKLRIYILLLLTFVLLAACNSRTQNQQEQEVYMVPQIDGDWWQVTTYHPDIAPYKYGKGDNMVCDFTMFKAKDNTWQLIACIRGNNYPGKNRFLYQWETKNITDTLWEEKGVFQSTGVGDEPDGFGNVWDPEFYPNKGQLQAPHCIIHEDKYYLFYNNRDAMCKISDDGKNWKDHKADNGSYHFFEMGRDLMMFDDTKQSGNWITYYTTGGAFPQFMEARTSESLGGKWSKGKMVYNGWSNTRNPIYGNEFAESPFVMRYDDRYYLFAQLHVFISDDPLDFTDNFKIADLESSNYHERVWAPEIIIDEDGQYYIAAYRPKGIFMAKLKFIETTTPCKYD